AGMENFIPALKDTVKKKNKFLDLSQGLKLLEAGKGIVKAHDRVNPHTWLSVKNAYEQLDTIYRKVASMDPNNEAYYKKNLKKAQSEFKSLDNQFEKTVAKFKGKDK
ncbi:metal ABC transporter substrate-binding protein, partial [Citrobacter sp. UMB8248A]|nr:metal ABC transporter substrate-binding protein [Citrobacter sp. UMB8248A]